ncbi:MAG: hypothetical protein ACD_60C00007G0010 [uncultured bacterium]|nr:MAG: hypothetical protein ACD_60C00007G0010 [uncultured bacterium]
MNTVSHILGFPRIGAHRELKKAVEAYWRGELSKADLEKTGRDIRETHWKIEAEAGLSFVTVGDFSWYDHVLDTSAMLGVVPERFGALNKTVDLDTIFCMARGQAPNTKETAASEMTKWFNTNYHYIVPEFSENQTFQLATDTLFKTIDEAQKLGHKVKPVILGPLSFLWLGKNKNPEFNPLSLLNNLLPIYNQIFSEFKKRNIAWVQVDEPILVLDLPEEWQNAFVTAYNQLNFQEVRSLLSTYFGSVKDNLHFIRQLPVQGLHIDLCSDQEQWKEVISVLPNDKIISLGVINGRNIWAADLSKALALLQDAKKELGERLWVGSSCSLLHVPVDLDEETELDQEIKNWLSFAKQKVHEIVLLANGLNQGEESIAASLAKNKEVISSRAHSARIHDKEVDERVKKVDEEFSQRKNPYAKRAVKQRELLKLPYLSTTTIGSFPQTQEIRKIRQDFKSKKIDHETYTQKIKEQIAYVIQKQESLGLDVLVHGEAERNDMVEYFGELLNGFAFTKNGWVQSYGSRCVKPPIIYGDVKRPHAMTVEWIRYAQSLTNRYVKGMLTGPVTILAWSFVRDDQSWADTALQIALALRDEVNDLEKAGIKIIQIDEPAFREALPLKKKDWQHYLDWAVLSFRMASSGVSDHIQIHTHMCYSEFNDVVDAIAALDADVITIESSRSHMELLEAFENFAYPNEIGPGVYDIHSPRIPSLEEVIARLEKALQYIPVARLWVNPDCGLKTRNWPEVEGALQTMVNAAKLLRKKYAKGPMHEVLSEH